MKTAPIGNKQEFDTEKTGPNMQSHSFTIVGIRSPQMQNSTVTYYYGHTWSANLNAKLQIYVLHAVLRYVHI